MSSRRDWRRRAVRSRPSRMPPLVISTRYWTGIASPPNPNGRMWSGFGLWTTRSKRRAGGSQRHRHARSHSKRRGILEGLGGKAKNGPHARRYRNGGNRGADEQAALHVGCARAISLQNRLDLLRTLPSTEERSWRPLSLD